MGNEFLADISVKHRAYANLSREVVALSIKRGVPTRLAILLIMDFDQNLRCKEGKRIHTGIEERSSLSRPVSGDHCFKL